MKMEIQIKYWQCHQRSKCCGDCGSKALIFLHNVCIRGAYRRLCTSCLFRHHSGSFCPICFDFYGDHPPPPHRRLMCLRCPSISHLSYVVPFDFLSRRPPRYQCPSCSNPNYFSSSSFRNGSSSRNNKLKSSDRALIDKGFAVKMMAAARIASVSMNKATSVAWFEAEMKVKEALLARNRAITALEHEAFSSCLEREK
ncbi:hypothetical protein U1Q18_029861 [Sarracenia purpurea var. burkii]